MCRVQGCVESMSLSEDHNADFESAGADSLESRAMALVNPASGLANDFLNVYNEILMLIELLPTMPELADDIAAWRPASYRAYFMQSPLPGSDQALAVYAGLDPGFRALFEANVEKLADEKESHTEKLKKIWDESDEKLAKEEVLDETQTERWKKSSAELRTKTNTDRYYEAKAKQAEAEKANEEADKKEKKDDEEEDSGNEE